MSWLESWTDWQSAWATRCFWRECGTWPTSTERGVIFQTRCTFTTHCEISAHSRINCGWKSKPSSVWGSSWNSAVTAWAQTGSTGRPFSSSGTSEIRSKKFWSMISWGKTTSPSATSRRPSTTTSGQSTHWKSPSTPPSEPSRSPSLKNQ